MIARESRFGSMDQPENSLIGFKVSTELWAPEPRFLLSLHLGNCPVITEFSSWVGNHTVFRALDL